MIPDRKIGTVHGGGMKSEKIFYDPSPNITSTVHMIFISPPLYKPLIIAWFRVRRFWEGEKYESSTPNLLHSGCRRIRLSAASWTEIGPARSALRASQLPITHGFRPAGPCWPSHCPIKPDLRNTGPAALLSREGAKVRSACLRHSLRATVKPLSQHQRPTQCMGSRSHSLP